MAKLFHFILFCILQFHSLSLNAYHLCPHHQRLSLLNFKDTLQIDTHKEHCEKQVGLHDYVYLTSYCDRHDNPIIESKISSWNNNTDCCKWKGITCDEFTGNVIELDISVSRLTGVIDSNSSLFRLSNLRRLSLAHNFLDGSKISTEFRRFTHLTHLNLTHSGFVGKIPSEISQLKGLVSLDLSNNDGLFFEPHVFRNLLQNMTRLRELSLSYVNISSSLPNNFSSSITIIDLSDTGLKGTFPFHIFHLPNLQQLSLGSNYNDDFVSLPSFKWNTSSPLQKLELYNSVFSGKLLDTIGNMKHLTYLDLSNCQLQGSLPDSFRNLTQLSHLNLNSNQLSGQIPRGILGLEHLIFLDIGSNDLDAPIPYSASIELKRLKVLSLENNNLNTSSVSSFLRNLTQLETIDLSSNPLEEIPLQFFDLMLLQEINLQHTQLHGPFPKSFFDFSDLRYLNVGFNNFSGPIKSKALSTLVSLEYLNLESNNFHGPIDTHALSKLVNLKYLKLELNNFTGPIETNALSKLVNLKYLNLASNNFDNTLDVRFLRNFKWMDTLDLSFNSLSLTNENNTTLPEISINKLVLASCNIRDLGKLRSITVKSVIYLPNNNMHGEIPEWAWSNWSNAFTVDLSNNSLTHIGSKIALPNLASLNLKSNLLEGQLPVLPHSILLLSLSNNKFHGEITSSICELGMLYLLDLSNNSFTGALPGCIGMMNRALYTLDLQMNNLHGTIPDTFSNISALQSLNLHGNHFEGEVPRSLINCLALKYLDLSDNNLNDSFPSWLGSLPGLHVLSLRSNRFYGPISFLHAPTNAFSEITILDLSYNQLSGSLPARLFQGLRQMKSLDVTSITSYFRNPGLDIVGSTTLDHFDSITMVLNGNTMPLERVLDAMMVIDLSCNHFEGEIPNSIASLFAIQRLNLSHNNFQGRIPPQLGNLSKLLTLDFSSNQLDGNIPNQLADLGFLTVMNLSYNHLTGRIPTGRQLQTFSNDSYIGNDGLCGFPLSQSCGPSMTQSPQVGAPDEDDDQEFFDGFTWQSVVMGYGVGMLVGCVISSLMLSSEKPKWLIRIVK